VGAVDYNALYALQDSVMETVFGIENIFYLTGGTCLSRFYHEERYSNDLDFFTHISARYSLSLRSIKNELQKRFDMAVEVESKDFNRVKINDILQIDFVNDFTYRDGDIVITPEGFLIDNVFNILSNKITAVMGRDNPKDIFDIYLIAYYYSFSWEYILDIAHKKFGFGDDELIVRLKTFPFSLLDKIKIKDIKFLDGLKKEYPKLIDGIYKKTEHKAIMSGHFDHSGLAGIKRHKK